MKKILLSSIAVCSLFAGDQNFIELGGGYSKIKDNFSTESDKTISSYSKASSKNETIPNLSFFYGTELNENATIYGAMEFGELFIGSEIENSLGMFDVGVKMNLMEEAWENPFLLNTERAKTDVQEIGGYIAYGMPLSENLMSFLRYELSSIEYDKDTTQKELKRDGTRHVLSLENIYDINKNTSLIGKLFYENYQADGDASSYDDIGLEVGILTHLNEDVELALMADLSTKEYEKANPVLNKTIDSTKTGLIASLKYKEPFKFKNTYVSVNAGVEREDANHDFYDKDNKFGMLSVGYTF